MCTSGGARVATDRPRINRATIGRDWCDGKVDDWRYFAASTNSSSCIFGYGSLAVAFWGLIGWWVANPWLGAGSHGEYGK